VCGSAEAPHNWMQLVKFSVVGATGYVINLAAFSALVEGAGVTTARRAVLASAWR